MKVTKKQKQQIEEFVYKINSFDKTELMTFAQKVYLSEQDLDAVVVKYTKQAIDIHMMSLQESTSLDAMAVISKLREGEVC